MREQVQKLAFELQVRGLMNVQFAVKDNEVYLIEVNPRAARTVPFVSKATGVPLAKVAARVMAGKTLAQQGVTKEIIPPYYSVKEVVLPFNKFPGVDPLLARNALHRGSDGRRPHLCRSVRQSAAGQQLDHEETGSRAALRPRRR